MVRADRGRWVVASYPQIPGRWVVAAACHQVAKGQELMDSYGPTFMEEERDDRRKRLFEDYRFPCRCLACFKKWPCTPDLAATIFEVPKSVKNKQEKIRKSIYEKLFRKI